MKNIDYSLLCAIVVLLFIGIVMVYSSSSYYALYQEDVWNSDHYFTKEIIWTVVGIIGMIVTMSIDYHTYKKVDSLASYNYNRSFSACFIPWSRY